jgi:hypothetical protein
MKLLITNKLLSYYQDGARKENKVESILLNGTQICIVKQKHKQKKNIKFTLNYFRWYQEEIQAKTDEIQK